MKGSAQKIVAFLKAKTKLDGLAFKKWGVITAGAFVLSFFVIVPSFFIPEAAAKLTQAEQLRAVAGQMEGFARSFGSTSQFIADQRAEGTQMYVSAWWNFVLQRWFYSLLLTAAFAAGAAVFLRKGEDEQKAA